MKKVLRLILLALIFFPAARPIPTAAAQTKNPDAARTKVRVILVLNEQSALVAAAENQQAAVEQQSAEKQQLGEQHQLQLEQMERPQRLRTVIDSLRGASNLNQRQALNRLNSLQSLGKVDHIRPFWIVNAIAVSAPAEMLSELAALPGVASITPDYSITLTDPPGAGMPGSSPAGLVPNLAQVNVSALWKMGYKGKGIVVANVDTGVSLDNPELEARWRGGKNSWFDPHEQYNKPVDTNGHGSATMGIMVSSSYGVAPEARWIAVKMFDDNLNANLSDALAGFQWLLDPDGDPKTDDAPNVVNNSWSENTPGCENDPTLHSALKALTAAGILPVFAAGNLGYYSGNGSLKKSTGPIPSIYPEVLAVGAVDVDSQHRRLQQHRPHQLPPRGAGLSRPGCTGGEYRFFQHQQQRRPDLWIERHFVFGAARRRRAGPAARCLPQPHGQAAALHSPTERARPWKKGRRRCLWIRPARHDQRPRSWSPFIG